MNSQKVLRKVYSMLSSCNITAAKLCIVAMINSVVHWNSEALFLLRSGLHVVHFKIWLNPIFWRLLPSFDHLLIGCLLILVDIWWLRWPTHSTESIFSFQNSAPIIRKNPISIVVAILFNSRIQQTNLHNCLNNSAFIFLVDRKT